MKGSVHREKKAGPANRRRSSLHPWRSSHELVSLDRNPARRLHLSFSVFYHFGWCTGPLEGPSTPLAALSPLCTGPIPVPSLLRRLTRPIIHKGSQSARFGPIVLKRAILPEQVYAPLNFEIEKDKKNMISRFKCMPPRMVLVLCSLILATLLVACGGGTASTPSATPTSKPSPTATPTPALTVYTGKGYSIGYPQRWKVTPSGKQVDFSDASDLYHVTVILEPNPGGAIDASTLVNDTIDGIKKTMKNPKAEPLPPTTTVGGDSWVQKSISGTESSNGQDVNLHIVVMSDNHPAHSTRTQNFTILYGTTNGGFATGETSYFQPMLKSFKFI